jgi:tetratricopeptide (TPR) repeat protein
LKSEIIQHISQENLLRYVEDDCSRTEMRDIDRHLATCPMCSDAVEGLMLLSVPSVVVDNLNKKIDEKVATWAAEKPIVEPIDIPVLTPILTVVKRPFWQQRWAAAAAVLLLVSGSFWIFNNAQKTDNKVVASSENAILPNSDTIENLNTPPQYAAAETAKNDNNSTPTTIQKEEDNKALKTTTTGTSDVAVVEDNGRFKDNLGKNQADGLSDKITEKESQRSSPSAEIAVEDNVAAKPAANASTGTYSSSPQYDRTANYPGAGIQNSVPRPETSVPTKPKDVVILQNDENIDGVKQSKSKEKREEVVATGAAKAKKYDAPKSATKQPAPATNASSTGITPPSVSTTSDQVLSRADGFFKQKYYETAAAEYTQFLNLEPSGNRHERALFQLATCYVNLNRKVEAKIIFQKLVGMNGQYERAAKKALKSL